MQDTLKLLLLTISIHHFHQVDYFIPKGQSCLIFLVCFNFQVSKYFHAFLEIIVLFHLHLGDQPIYNHEFVRDLDFRVHDRTVFPFKLILLYLVVVRLPS